MAHLEGPEYPELDRVIRLWPGPQVLLGRPIYWQEKRDGSFLRARLHDGEVVIASRHQEPPSDSFGAIFAGLPAAEKVKELLLWHSGLGGASPLGNFNFGPVIFGELLSKGKSPARVEYHDASKFVVFDIWSTKAGRFLPYPAVYSLCVHFDLACVESWALTQHSTLEDIWAQRDAMLALAQERGREGVVLKAFDGDTALYAKEKLDQPRVERVKLDTSAVHLPPLADSEVFGAIAKAQADLGVEGFREKAVAMPLIAKYTAEEMQKHLCGKPVRSFYAYYLEFLETT